MKKGYVYLIVTDPGEYHMCDKYDLVVCSGESSFDETLGINVYRCHYENVYRCHYENLLVFSQWLRESDVVEVGEL